MMDFTQAALLGSYISKDYAEDLFRLLVTYKSISASEAASRLSLHIKTAQDFLDAMVELDILDKEEATEKKRPYFRYTLKKKVIRFDLDLRELFDVGQPQGQMAGKIREHADAGARFTISRDGQYISNVYISEGQGRERKERKLNLTLPQGKFLFYLPFPSAEPETVSDIMKKAGVNKSYTSEVLDILNALVELEVVERK